MWPVSFLVCLAVIAVVLVLSLKLFSVVTVGRCRSKRDMSGKTVLITGANADSLLPAKPDERDYHDNAITPLLQAAATPQYTQRFLAGIGKETAKELCRRRARVIMACRDLDKARAAANEISRETGSHPVCMRLDLCSLKSVRQFAQQVVDSEDRLDVLINNAGGLAPPCRRETEDGFEVTFQSNYLGHFLLTNLLLGLMKRSAPSRIINVGSAAHWFGTFDGDVSFKRYNRNRVYASAKLYCMLFTKELAQQLAGSGVTASCCHPGVVKSSFADRYGDLYTRMMKIFLHVFGKSVEDGAQTSVHLAVSEEVEGFSGKMFTDCKPFIAPGTVEDARALWKISQRMAGLS